MWGSRLVPNKLIRTFRIQAGPLKSEKWQEGIKKLMEAIKEHLEKKGLPKPTGDLKKDLEAVDKILLKHTELAQQFLENIKVKFEKEPKQYKERLTEELEKMSVIIKEMEEIIKNTTSQDLKSVLECVKKQIETIRGKSNVKYDETFQKEFKNFWNELNKEVKERTATFHNHRTVDIYYIHSNIEHSLSEAKRALSLPDSMNRTEVINHQKDKLIKFFSQLESMIVKHFKKSPELRPFVQKIEKRTVGAIAAIALSKEKIHMLNPELIVTKMTEGYNSIKTEIITAIEKGMSMKSNTEMESAYKNIECWLKETERDITSVRKEVGKWMALGRENLSQNAKDDLERGFQEITGKLKKLLEDTKASFHKKMNDHPEFRFTIEDMKTIVDDTLLKAIKDQTPQDLQSTLVSYLKLIENIKNKTRREFGGLKKDLIDIKNIFANKQEHPKES